MWLCWARAFIKRYVYMPTCMWGTWNVVIHVEETHTESHKKIWADSVNGSHRNSTLKLFLSCLWRSVTWAHASAVLWRHVPKLAQSNWRNSGATSKWNYDGFRWPNWLKFSMSAPLGALILLVVSDPCMYVLLAHEQLRSNFKVELWWLPITELTQTFLCDSVFVSSMWLTMCHMPHVHVHGP